MDGYHEDNSFRINIMGRGYILRIINVSTNQLFSKKKKISGTDLLPTFVHPDVIYNANVQRTLDNIHQSQKNNIHYLVFGLFRWLDMNLEHTTKMCMSYLLPKKVYVIFS